MIRLDLRSVPRRYEPPAPALWRGWNRDSNRNRLRGRIRSAWLLSLVSLVSSNGLAAQDAGAGVNIKVNGNQEQGLWKPTWIYFGYDEPNHTYSPNAKKLLGELAVLSPVPVYIRTHNLFTSGDGSASVKWGSTNVYTEDASGEPIYDWTIVGRIFDTYQELAIKPLVELGFMPEALSVKPEPYRHNFPEGPLYTGWAYPPKSHQKWADLVFHFVKHLRERYGDVTTRGWLWEVWNEPDIGYWQGTRDEFKLYDYAVAAVLRALPGAHVGGPDTTGPLGDSAAEFLHVFLDHYALQSNYATSKTGAPLDFVSFHAKGTPSVENGHVQMGIRNQLAAIQRGFEIVTSFPSGGTLRSSWENPIQKAAPPARPRNILKALTEMAQCSHPIRRRS